MSPEAKDFLTYDYAELKDLAKAFITLISAVLVFSITFSDKVIDFPKAGRLPRNLLFLSWGCFGLAVVGAGIALCLNYQAEVMAVHPEWVDPIGSFLVFWNIASISMLLSGCLFVSGLGGLLASAIFAANERREVLAVEMNKPSEIVEQGA